MSTQLKNIAVLIDADNASARNIGIIFQEIEKLGHISCKKIYGDWGNANIQSWQEALLKYAIDPMQQFAYVKGKNATDIGMVIEAMDLLYSGLYDGFCLISSDSDFTSLALRIRKNHVKVFGFGKRSTVNAFSQACDRFFYVEDLLNERNNLTKNMILPSKSSSQVVNDIPLRWTTKQLHTQNHLISVINKLINENPNNANGWSDISYLAREINKNHSNIKLEKYGYKKFSDLISALRLYDMRRENNAVLIKLKVKRDTLINSKQNEKPHLSSVSTINPTSKSVAAYFPSSPIVIEITNASTIDAALFRVNGSEKVRGDEDMIFYGQTHSEDASIELYHQLEDDHSISTFSCDLNLQPNDIKQLNFTLSSELESLAHGSKQAPIRINIINKQKDTLLFSGEFDTKNKSTQSLLLFTLNRIENQWQFVPKHQSVDGDLRYLCEQYGIELSDD